MSSTDVLILTVAATAAPKLNAPPVITKEARGSLARDLRDDLPRDYANDFLTAFASLAGLPAVSVPFGRTSIVMPVGVQVVGRAFDEATVLRTARRLGCSGRRASSPGGACCCAMIWCLLLGPSNCVRLDDRKYAFAHP